MSFGFSLAELLLVLAIISILLSMAAPAFQNLLEGQRVASVANEFFLSLHLARSEAIRRGTRVDLVPAGPGRDWNQGWIVLIDRNQNARCDPGEELIATHGPVPPGVSIQSVLTDSSRPYIAFQETGRTRTDTSRDVPQFGNVNIRLNNHARRIVINLLGRARICTPAAGTFPC